MTLGTFSNQLAEKADRWLMPAYGSRDLVLSRGEGAWVWDADGNKYLDFLSGIGVNGLGHCHPAVVSAIRDQAGKLLHTSNAFLNQPQIELCELLCTELGFDKAFIGNSGAEVAEAAIKLARLWSYRKNGPGHEKIIVFEGGYHGRTMGALSATSVPIVREEYGPHLPGFIFAKFNDLDDVDALWEEGVCGVMLETVQGWGGIVSAEEEFLRGLRERCDQRGAALIIDEVQCGMSRTGRRMAYEWPGVKPDILAIAKALGGGVAIGAILGRGEIAETFTKGKHGTTFGGNPLACAAALAATPLLFSDELLENVGQRGCQFWGEMEKIVKDFPGIADHVRGKGLMLGLQLKIPAADVVAIGRKHGLLFNATAGTVLRFLPPLIVSEEEISEAGRRLYDIIRDAAASS